MMFTTRSIRVPLWTLFLILTWIPAILGARSPVSVLDLSYKHYVDTLNLKDAIRARIWDMHTGERPLDIEVDISYSILGHIEGMKSVFETLFPLELDEDLLSSTPIRISLLTRGNRITPEIMDGLIGQILNERSGETQKKAQDEGKTETDDRSSFSEKHEGIKTNSRVPWTVSTVDVGWNELHPDASGWKKFVKSLEKLVTSTESCPQIIRLDRCGLVPGACRAIGKGIINRFESSDNGSYPPINELSIYLCGNPELGDPGCAAIAAAIRTLVTDHNKEETPVIFDTLDLSGCEVGDTGAEALALALESCSGLCIRHLNLSNNKITDAGAAQLGHALLSSEAEGNGKLKLESLDLSGNKDIGDQAAITIASVVGNGLLSSIAMRSCHISADGAAAFGKAIVTLSNRGSVPYALHIDLSGNALGVLRGKTDKGNKYSASAIKSKASATTAAYMNMIRKGVRSGLKNYGVEMGSTIESDDEEEARDGMGNDFVNEGDLDPKKARCGIKAFANAIVGDTERDEKEESVYPTRASPIKCELGMRRCFLDHSAADALAAVLVYASDEMGIELTLDVGLNPVLEEDMTQALEGNKLYNTLLRDMAERHMDALEALRVARERAAEAAESTFARVQAEADYESQWDAPELGFDEEEDEWDSDADYDREEYGY